MRLLGFKGKAIGSTLKGMVQHIWIRPVETEFVGDIELEDFKERYRALADKHEAMIAFMM
jgi:adenylosuccinate synthase